MFTATLEKLISMESQIAPGQKEIQEIIASSKPSIGRQNEQQVFIESHPSKRSYESSKDEFPNVEQMKDQSSSKRPFSKAFDADLNSTLTKKTKYTIEQNKSNQPLVHETPSDTYTYRVSRKPPVWPRPSNDQEILKFINKLEDPTFGKSPELSKFKFPCFSSVMKEAQTREVFPLKAIIQPQIQSSPRIRQQIQPSGFPSLPSIQPRSQHLETNAAYVSPENLRLFSRRQLFLSQPKPHEESKERIDFDICEPSDERFLSRSKANLK